MRLPRPLWLVLPAIFMGCAPATVKLGGDDAPGTHDTADSADTGGDDTSGTVDSGSDSGETGEDSGHTGGDTGTPSATSYEGEVEGRMTFTDPDGHNTNTLECSGSTTFVVSGDGDLSGEAACGTGPQEIEGDMVGSVNGSAINATWTVHLGPNSVNIPLTGSISGSRAAMHGEFAYEGVGSFAVAMDAGSR